jgi:hypothetical protein
MKTRITNDEYDNLVEYCRFMQNDPCKAVNHGCITHGVEWECCGCPEERAFKEERNSKFSDVLKMLDNSIIKDFFVKYSNMITIGSEYEELSRKYTQVCEEFKNFMEESIEVCDD